MPFHGQRCQRAKESQLQGIPRRRSYKWAETKNRVVVGWKTVGKGEKWEAEAEKRAAEAENGQ